MPRRALPLLISLAAGVAAAVVAGGCGLTITNEPPPYEELDKTEQGVIERVLVRLRGVDAALRARGHGGIPRVLSRDAIQVAAREQILALTIGDGKIHLSVWENLSDRQRELVRGWFGKATVAGTAEAYRRFFYDYLATALGFREFMYATLSADYVHGNKSAYTIERHTQRAAAAYFVVAGEQYSMWGFVDSACAPLRAQYDRVYGGNFDQYYLRDHLQRLSDPADPTGYAYFICRFFALAKTEMVGLTRDVRWLTVP